MKYFSRNKYLLLVNAIGITVAFTMNFPELIALFSPEEANTVYPGLNWTQVGSEVLFTYLSIIILFWLNRMISSRSMGVINALINVLRSSCFSMSAACSMV